jgi:hypothetical protein
MQIFKLKVLFMNTNVVSINLKFFLFDKYRKKEKLFKYYIIKYKKLKNYFYFC